MNKLLQTHFVRLSCWSLARVSVFSLVLVAFVMVGCGGNGGPGSGSTFSGNTNVTVVATSTANDQLFAFELQYTSLSLMSKTGTVSTVVFNTSQNAEAIHLNGIGEPLATASIPQGEYISATVTLESGVFDCAYFTPGSGIIGATYQFDGVSSNQVSVNLPEPLEIRGESQILNLNLLVSKSASWSGNCWPLSGPPTDSLTPTFNLTTATIATEPTNISNGKLLGLSGQVTAVGAGGSSLTIQPGDGFGVNSTWTVGTNSSTVFTGISGPNALVVGMPVAMDVILQQSGAMQASRVEVDDTNVTDLSLWRGPIEIVFSPAVLYSGCTSSQCMNICSMEEQGYSITQGYVVPDNLFNYSNAVFQNSSAMSNVQNLPFSASFTAANMVPGQSVLVTYHDTSILVPPQYATTVTLMPQTLNGTIDSIATSGEFTTYTITLSQYDLFPNMALYEGNGSMPSLLTDPSQVIVYVDNNTQMLNSSPLAVGNVMRCYGLIFNDNGTLRMDCAQVNDGVAE